MSAMKFKLSGQVFDVKLTLGDGKILKKDFGVTDLTKLNMGDVDILSFILRQNYGREHPEMPQDQVCEFVDGLDFFSFEDLNKAEADADAQDPTPAATGGEVVSDGSGSDGTPVTSQAEPGVQP